MVQARDIIEARNARREARDMWVSYWQELAEVLQPTRADFYGHSPVGEDRNDDLYDSVPMQARRSLAATLDGMVKPKTKPWFMIRAADDALNESEAAKLWLEAVKDMMWGAIYAPRAQFIQRSGEVDNDLVTFGTGILFIGERRGLNGLLFRSYHLRDCLIEENSDGVVDTIYITERMSARKAERRFGRRNIGRKALDLLSNNKAQEKIEYVQCVKPRADRDPGMADAASLPFAEAVVEVDSEHVVTEGGFHEFPFAVPRWETASGEVYGRSPGMVALPDAQSLQVMGKTLLVAGQRAVDPPIWVMDDGVNLVRTRPGGVTSFDAEQMRSLGGRPPMGAVDVGGQIPLGAQMQDAVRENVWRAFYRNVLQLPIDGPQMTATEVMQRREEFIREIGPTFGRLESGYIAPIVNRVFGIMSRVPGLFPPPPEELAGRGLRFEFQSPVQQARKAIEAAGAAQGLELLAPFVGADPEIMDNFDGDRIARDMPEIGGFPLDWLRSEEDVAALRQSRAQQAELAQALAAGQQAADIADTAGIDLTEVAA